MIKGDIIGNYQSIKETSQLLSDSTLIIRSIKKTLMTLNNKVIISERNLIIIDVDYYNSCTCKSLTFIYCLHLDLHELSTKRYNCLVFSRF
jgi:hypothetical protein